MPGRYFNWKLAIVLVIGFVVLGATAFGLRRWQRANRAEHGLVLGNKAFEEKRWEEAANQLGRYISVERNDVQALLKYAEAQLNVRPLKRANLQQAVTACRNALRVEENNAAAAIKLTGLYLMTGMPSEAELIAGRYLEANDNPELRRMLATAFARLRKFEQAAAELEGIIKKHPEQVLAYEALGQLVEQRPEGMPGPPSRWYNEAVKNNPSSALAYISRAGFSARSRDRTTALSDLERAEKLDLSDPTVRLRLAQGFSDANSLAKAEEHLAAVQAVNPTDQGLWQIWAQTALRSRSKAKMVEVAEKGLESLSSQPWDFMPLAVELFIRGGRIDRANEYISKLNEKDISPETVAFLRGFVAMEEQKPRVAVTYWQQSIELGNKSPQVRLALASALSFLGDSQSALRHLRTLVAENPNSVNGFVALARHLARAGNWTEAAEYARRALQLSQTNADAVLVLLQAQMQRMAENPGAAQTQSWDDVQNQLSSLEKASGGALDIRLMRFQVAVQRGNFAEAETLLAQLKKDREPQPRIAMAEVVLLTAQKKEDEAASLLVKTIEKFPQALDPVTYLAIMLSEQGDKDKCETVLKEAIARIEQPGARRELGLLLARLYARWGRSEQIYPMLSALAEKLPEDIPVKIRLLRCEPVVKDIEKAQRLVDDIKSIEGGSAQYWRYEQARLWFMAGDFRDRQSQIISLLQENLQANPDDIPSQMLLAGVYEKAGDLKTAISRYREALSRSPQDVRIITLTVGAMYRAEEYDEAEKILKQASRDKLQDPQLQRLQLQSYLMRGQLDTASDILQDYLTGDPNDNNARLAFAQLKIRQGKYAEAAELLDKIRVQEPNSLQVIAAQIQLYIRQNKSEEAIKLCDGIVKDLNSASAYILRARAYNMVGQVRKAAEDLDRAAAIEPRSAAVWTARSDFYSSTGQTEKASADIEQALALDPNNVLIQRRLVLLLLTSGNSEKIKRARSLLDKTLAANPENSEMQLLKASSLLAEGTGPASEEARQLVEKITEQRPKLSEAWVMLGEILLRQGQPAKALDAAMRGLVNKTNDKALMMLKARAEAARSPVLAIPTLRQLYDLDSNDVDVGVFLAEVFTTTGSPAKAVDLLKKQLAACETSERRRCNLALAVALYKNGNKADAQKEFESLHAGDPNDPNPVLTQARLLRDEQLWSELMQKADDWRQRHPKDTKTPVTIAADTMGAKDEQAKKTSEDILRMTLKQDPNCTEAMTVLGVLLQATGRTKEAAELYQKVLALKADDIITMNNLAWIMCEELGQHQQALELTQRALKVAPAYLDVLDTRGVVYYRLGQFEKAIQDFDTCLKYYPSGAPASTASYFHLARALAAAGQKDKAREQLRKALDLQSLTRGLAEKDLAEARLLLEELSRGG